MAEDISLDVSKFPSTVSFRCVEDDDIGVGANEFAVLARKICST